MPQIRFSAEEEKIPTDLKISSETCWGTDCFALMLALISSFLCPCSAPQNCQTQKQLCASGLQWPEEALGRDFSPFPAEARLGVAETRESLPKGGGPATVIRSPGSQDGERT